MTGLRSTAVLFVVVFIVGCTDSTEKKPEKKGIIGKTTQDVGKFDPNEKKVVSDQKIHASDPITAPLSAYGPMVESISKTQIKSAVEIFNATEGRYPKDHAEFMEKIIKANNIQLPVLPFKGQYQYDEAKHELVIVRSEEDAKKAQQ